MASFGSRMLLLRSTCLAPNCRRSPARIARLNLSGFADVRKAPLAPFAPSGCLAPALRAGFARRGDLRLIRLRAVCVSRGRRVWDEGRGPKTQMPLLLSRAPRPCLVICMGGLHPHSSIATVRFPEGFRTPAPNTTGGAAAGPASESLGWRKPRAGRGSVWASELWGFEGRGVSAGIATRAGGG
jgi:hypothetical protein